MRQLAWLHSTIAPKECKSQKNSSVIQRWEKIKSNGGRVDMPPIDTGEYLIEYLWEVGLTNENGIQSSAITYSEINAWQEACRINLQPWEVGIIKKLSEDYILEVNRAKDPECGAPYGNPDFDRTVISKKIGSAFKTFLRDKK